MKAAAMQAGEQDWWENPTHDLLPLLRKEKNIKIAVNNPTGSVNMMRPNHLQPPFNNPATLRALFYAIDQSSFMEAIVGTDPSMYHTPHGFFCSNTPMASDVGLESLHGSRHLAKVKEMLKQAGYAGEKVSMLVATDYAQFKAIGDVASDMMNQVGMNVDYVATDWGTMLQRRNNKGPVDQGGWSCFFTGWEGEEPHEPFEPLRDTWQWRRPLGVAQLVHQPPAGGAAQRLVRRTQRRGATENLSGHAASMHGGRSKPSTRPIRAANGTPQESDRRSEWLRHFLERPPRLATTGRDP